MLFGDGAELVKVQYVHRRIGYRLAVDKLRPVVYQLFDLLYRSVLVKCATLYTQLSDVEEEINGILTYDRRENKFAGMDLSIAYTADDL